jgi:Zn-dependent M28 family amino/carboxypeptidase
MNNIIKIIFLFAFVFSIQACENDSVKSVKRNTQKKVAEVVIPDFNADSAYNYVAKQVSFGPRVPGTKAHAECASYLINYFKARGIKVYEQKFKSRSFDNKILNGINIIAAINPEAQSRILLTSHWDSRPFADHDPDKKNHYTPIDGANDGASGVGVLMEIARQMSIKSPKIGIDIILLDLEDYGQHADEQQSINSENSWGLGAQYWAKNPHIPGYDARFGILLDMVGAKDAVFGEEYYSKHYAPGVLKKVWRIAQQNGYEAYFRNIDGGGVLDDHVFINKFAYIPTIDIIHHDSNTDSGFFPYWHTIGDNMDVIEKSTLKAVGQTLLAVAYGEN